MHLSEFKAWFEGFTEEMSGTPNKAQWARIKKRVGEITNDYTPSPIFIEKYARPYRQWWNDRYMLLCERYSKENTTLGRGTTLDKEAQKHQYAALRDWRAAGRAELHAA